MNTPSLLEFELGTEPAAIATLADRIEAFGEAHDWPPRTAFDVNLALDELLTNTISHGFAGRASGHIRVTLRQRERRLEIEVVDDAVAFDPLSAPPPDLDSDLDDRPIGGLGVYLVRELMDEVAYARVDGRNRLSLVKRLD